jgi:hypothetical protein
MAGPLNDELEKRFPWLFRDLGFRLTHYDCSRAHMGDSVAEIQSNSLRIRFIRDRSRIQVELASATEAGRWFELGLLWYALTGQQPEPELDGWVWFLRDHLSELAEALGPELSQTKKEFQRRQEENREILARYMPPINWTIRLGRFKTSPLGMIFMGPLGWIIAAGLTVLMFLFR